MTLIIKSGLAQSLKIAFHHHWAGTFTRGRRKVSCTNFSLQLDIGWLQTSKDSGLNSEGIQDLTQSDQRAYSHLPERETRTIAASSWIQV